MAKRKAAVKKTAKPAAKRSTKATEKEAECSPCSGQRARISGYKPREPKDNRRFLYEEDIDRGAYTDFWKEAPRKEIHAARVQDLETALDKCKMSKRGLVPKEEETDIGTTMMIGGGLLLVFLLTRK